MHLCIPEHLAIQLNLAELERREVALGHGLLLGAIPIQDTDLELPPSCRVWI